MSLRGLSRTDRLLLGIVLVAALLVALVAWLVVPPEKSGGLVKQPSTLFNVGYGTKAAYLVLGRLGYPVARLRRPIGEETLSAIGVLFILKPQEGLRDDELSALEAWVKEGHGLVVVPGRSSFEHGEHDSPETPRAVRGSPGSARAVRGSPDPAQAIRAVRGSPDSAQAIRAVRGSPDPAQAMTAGRAVRGSPDPAQVMTAGLQQYEETFGQTSRRGQETRAERTGLQQDEETFGQTSRRGQETRAERKKRRGQPPPPRSSLEEWFALEEVAGHRDETVHAYSRSDRPESGSLIDGSEPLCAGIRELAAGSDYRFRQSPLRGALAEMAPKVFWKDDLGIVGVRATVGQGTVVALADAYPLTNLGISDADNGLLLGNLADQLSEQYPGSVAFDEYHHGFAERDWSPVAMAKLMLSGDWRWAVAQAVLVGLLALYGRAVRFGSPRDVAHKPRRQHREFAEAAGRLLDEAGAVSLAAATLYRYYRDRLCRLVHLEPDADDDRLSRAVHDRSGQDIGELLYMAHMAASGATTGRGFMTGGRGLMKGGRGFVKRQELLAIARELHRVVEALDHGA
jgi:hypothetical protein